MHIILERIDQYVAHARNSNEMIGNVESDPEYQLIVEANSIAADIDNEICMYYIKLSMQFFSLISILFMFKFQFQQ